MQTNEIQEHNENEYADDYPFYGIDVDEDDPDCDLRNW
jgi:hypothetical protein